MQGLTKVKIRTTALAFEHSSFSDCLLLDFLNAARKAEDIREVNSEIAPPKVLDLEGKEVLIKSFTLSDETAHAILEKRVEIGGSFRQLSDLSGIKSFGEKELITLLNAVGGHSVSVVGIWFNHDPNGFTTDAIPMRRNAFDAIPIPEWQNNGNFRKPEDSPACYSIADTRNKTIRIRVRMIGPPNQTIFVRAKNIGDSKFGMPARTKVVFDASGDSGWVEFAIRGGSFRNKGVRIYDVCWKWYFAMHEYGSFCPLDELSYHRIYAILEAPNAPWVLLQGSNQAPWQSALELACNWARDKRHIDEAAGAITLAHYRSGFKYSGIPNYSSPFDFFLTDYLTKMADMENNPLPDHVNCSDCASAVSTLANLLGHDLWQSQMGLEGPSFQYRKITPIGEKESATGSFVFHEVAWKGDCDHSENLFDGCLKVNDFPKAILPIDIPFGTCNSGDYRQKMTSSAFNGCPLCPEKPDTRKRRFLI